uniref:Choline transporter-like protein n=1 Tax=Tetraselmis chuii TaxID=63592 RepID=A0A6U1HQ90_9CHLO|mmetsp:Transcript_27391/g.48797  ORF Transcript_27391/g.48797 Transcript_27391/m.48797 type:complete len:565 (+) Transcript_27391:128-1822(+)
MASYQHVGTAVVVETAGEEERGARLLEPSLRNGYFETENRPKRDVAWSKAYAVLSVLMLLGGVVSFFTRDKDFALHTSPEYLNESMHCSPGRVLEEGMGSLQPSPYFAPLLFGSVLGSVGMAVLFAVVLRKQAMVAVLGSVLTVAVACLASAWVQLSKRAGAEADDDQMSVGYAYLFFGVIYLIFPVVCWRRLKLTANLLKVSGQGLAENPGLTVSTISIAGTTFIVLLVQMGLAGLGVMNGSVVPSPEDAPPSAPPCQYRPHAGGIAYFLLCLAMLLWTSAIGGQMSLFTIAGTIGQWYYAPEGTSTRGTTKLSLGFAMRPSFGSLCLAGMAITLINIARSAVNSFQRRFGVCCAWIFQVLLSWMSLFTKFSTIRMAITGDSFFDSAKGVMDLLKRNGRDAFTVWWFPAFVLRMFAIISAFFYGAVVSLLALAAGANCMQIMALAFVSGATCAVSLSFVASIMLNIVDSVFICWVMDCDRKQVTRVEVHEVFTQVPLAKPAEGLAVEQPDGSYAYAPSHPMGAVEGATPYSPPSQAAVVQGTTYPTGYAPVAPSDHDPEAAHR